MMTSVRTAAVSAARGTIGSLEFEILDLDPDVTALIAARRPPAPPVTGSDFSGPTDWTVLRCAGPPPCARQCHPCRPCNAARRSQTDPPTKVTIRLKGR